MLNKSKWSKKYIRKTLTNGQISLFDAKSPRLTWTYLHCKICIQICIFCKKKHFFCWAYSTTFLQTSSCKVYHCYDGSIRLEFKVPMPTEEHFLSVQRHRFQLFEHASILHGHFLYETKSLNACGPATDIGISIL